MGVSEITRYVFMMAQGASTRLAPGTWKRTKAVWPMVGTTMIRRITDHLYAPQGFTDITIKTALFQKQIAEQFLSAANMPGRINVGICPGEESDRYLDRNNTAAGVLLAYKQRWLIDSLADLVRLPASSALRDIAGAKYSELKGKLKKGKLSGPERTELDALVGAAADFVSRIKPLHDSISNAKPFLVTGVDALTTANLSRLAEFYLQASGSGHHANALGAIKIKEFPWEASEQVKNYGVVLMSDHLVTGFEEKSSKPKQYVYAVPGQNLTVRSYLVNPQIYYFDPAVLAVVELLVHYGESTGFSPDWGSDILPILARSGQLLGQIMGKDEYWNDMGDYGTYLATGQDILRRDVIIPISGEELARGCWNNGALLPAGPATPTLEGPFYLGPKAIISSTANIRNSIIEAGAVVHGKVDGSVIFEGAVIPSQAEIIHSIVHEEVILPPVSIRIENEILATTGNGIILRTKIPYDDNGLPRNARPDMPTIANFPNR
jgi:NDP-sugar pyrophosphorylase family protein